MIISNYLRKHLGVALMAGALGLGAVACNTDRDRVVSEKAVDKADEAADKAKEAANTDDIKKARDEMEEAGREIGKADEKVAEHSKDLAEAKAKVNKEVAEGKKEIGDAFVALQDDMRMLNAKNADFEASKARMVGELEAHVEARHRQELALPARITTQTSEDTRKKVNDLDAEYREAGAAITRLKAASAQSWDDLRDKALDASVDYDKKVADATDDLE